MAVFELCEYKCGLGEFADAAGADGDPLECSPAAGEQREAAFAEAAGGAVQGVVGLGVGGEDLPVSGLFDRHLDPVPSSARR